MTPKRDNYRIQADQAKAAFLSYDQQKLIEKLHLVSDDDYLYVTMLCKQYRLHRRTGSVERKEETWVDGNTFEEVMTLLDLVCDSREDRHISGSWKNMQSFGLNFHTGLLEEPRNPWAEEIQQQPEKLIHACEALGGRRITNADIAYSFELFDGLCIALCFWYADEDFPPQIRYFWDENAGMYIRYETMYFAVNLLQKRLKSLI